MATVIERTTKAKVKAGAARATGAMPANGAATRASPGRAGRPAFLPHGREINTLARRLGGLDADSVRVLLCFDSGTLAPGESWGDALGLDGTSYAGQLATLGKAGLLEMADKAYHITGAGRSLAEAFRAMVGG